MPSSHGSPGRRTSPSNDDDDLSSSRYPAGPPSIISSRMTDIASEDGDSHLQDQSRPRTSGIASESRPGTARTGLSSSRGAWSQATPLRHGLQRGSFSGSSTGPAGRPLTSASRSHVPSLTSHAFFRPMSSQKLQAQRGASRPTTSQNRTSLQLDPTEEHIKVPTRGASPTHHAVSPSRSPTHEADGHRPPSRGTEATEHETYDRGTATSPSQGHHPTASLSESVRPLRRKKADDMALSVNVDPKNGHPGGANLPAPAKSPRSFRSNFMMSSKGESAGAARDMHGAEKLSSGASSPRLMPPHPQPALATTEKVPLKDIGRGRNHEYFEGNTVFCIGGRLQNTRHRPINIATGFLVVLPGVLFFATSAPYLWQNVSPAVPLIFAYLYYICVSSFLHASGSDPGVSGFKHSLHCSSC
jgi:palmitoyltransferase ZDHHC9/14/18